MIVLAILDHVAFPKTSDFEGLHTMRDTKTDECVLDAFTFKFIEPPKFNKTLTQLETVEDRWIYFLKHAAEESEVSHDFDGTTVEKAYDALERYNFNQKQINAYEDAALALVDFKNTSNVRYEEGLEEGMERGLEKGKQDMVYEVALNMLSKNLPDEMILEITKMTQNELNKLKSK